ncbi:MAG: hypothetical protein ACI86H_002655 [bacterium]|jgi:hypothetical protein
MNNHLSELISQIRIERNWGAELGKKSAPFSQKIIFYENVFLRSASNAP